jgi:(heptosyl)LPS beta-1,4-glucosyltransferase
MDKISATIITHNEERNIERCLNSLCDVADEIIIVDSESDDQTVEICRRYGCKITVRQFAGFGSQRQYATSLATHNYVLSIDADEVLSEEMRSDIMRLKAEGFTHRVYGAEVINYFGGEAVRHSGWQPIHDIRLFNKRYANWDLRDLGERVTFSDSVTPERLDGCIHHYRCADKEELRYKSRRESTIRAKVIAAQRKSIMPGNPCLKAILAWLQCEVRQMAMLDGEKGRFIAHQRCVSTYNAYREARDSIKQRQEK